MSADAFEAFCSIFEPLEKPDSLPLLTDKRTGALYCECHLQAGKLVELATTDVPLDLDEPEYRANREIVANAEAFITMKADAVLRRSFSNIVAEFLDDYSGKPLKIIGGQHRIEVIGHAFNEKGVDELHGVKVYFNLSTEQRLDVQLISNTNIAISADLIDRMQETAMGPELRQWCQSVGLLPENTDFAGKYSRSGPISVALARNFIVNYYDGKAIDLSKFDSIETTPRFGQGAAWEEIRNGNDVWNDQQLREAAKQFAALIQAQRQAFAGKKPKPKPDFPEKALNAAVVAAWAYVAGALQANQARLARHYALAATAGRDPMNAAILAKGHHKTDPDNYRGLGYRTDAKERGRLVELFYLQAENGNGISAGSVDAAIKGYHAKQAALEAQMAREKAANG
jgi:hypothetical protein